MSEEIQTTDGPETPQKVVPDLSVLPFPANLIDSLNKKVTDMEAGMNKAIRAGKNIDDLEERIEEMEDKLKKKM
jgi:hypothetical protein